VAQEGKSTATVNAAIKKSGCFLIIRMIYAFKH
jgi:hypothetical protein